MQPEASAHCDSAGWWGLYVRTGEARDRQLAELGRLEETEVQRVVCGWNLTRHLSDAELVALTERAERHGARIPFHLADRAGQIFLRDIAVTRKAQTGRQMLWIGLAALLSGLLFWCSAVSLISVWQAQRAELHQAEMRDLARLRR